MKYPVAFVLALMASACATNSYQAPADVPLVRMVEIHAPAENVWDAAIKYFSETNVPIDNMDRSSLFIKTKPLDVSATFPAAITGGGEVAYKNEMADCGRVTLEPVYSSMKKISVSFNMVLKPRTGNQTDVTTNVFFDGVQLARRDSAAVGNDLEMQLKCVSTGKFEHELQQYLQTHATTH